MAPWEDRISALPVNLLHHILSFLPIKDAAATTILSKKWNPLWFSQLTLNLDDQDFPDPSTFREMFKCFITKRDNTLPILSFQLICRRNHYSKHDIPIFVKAVVKRNVEYLSIDLSNSLFPTPILAANYLSVLKLMRLKLDNFPVVYLPSLKFLHLGSVTFTSYLYLVQLLSSCPVLEELETKDLSVEKTYRVHPDCPMTIVKGLSKLARANISGLHVGYDCLKNAEHLQLHVMAPYELINKFHNLTYLEFAFDLLPGLGFLKWIWVMNDVLPNTPKLQTLIIHELDTVNNFGDKEWVEPAIVPECLLHHLTKCSIRNYSSISWELPFSKYIMQNSCVLRTMTIQVAKSVESDAKIQMCKELTLCPMKSATCDLLFI